MEMRSTQRLLLVLALVIIVCGLAPSPAKAAPTLRTDQPLYTTRDKQVTLTGSGFSGTLPYYVWSEGPKDNATHYTGVDFVAISGGQVPPGTSLPMNATAALGTYLVSVSSSSTADRSQAIAHYGIWGTTNPLCQRTQTVQIVGGGVFPGISFRLTIRDPAGNFVHQTTLVSATTGDFNHTWRIPENAVTDAYSVFMDGTGVYDDAQQDFVSVSRFTVTQAVLSVSIISQPAASYERTQTAKISLTFKYPDGTPVLKSLPNSQPVVLLLNQSIAALPSFSLADPTNGVWEADSRIPRNATLNTKYRFGLPSMSFDDGFGNKGAGSDTFSNNFEVRSAALIISSELNGTQIQVPFGQVSIISKVNYPDGTPLTNGTVRVFVSTGTSNSDLTSVYDLNLGAWRASYSSAFSDLWRTGTWTLKVQASDPFGNSATESYEVKAQPYLFIVSIAVLVAIVLFSRWAVSRFGRKTYFRLRKISQRFRRSSLR
jgi:hypothetical protein